MTDSLARRDWFVEAQARRFMSLGVGVPTEALQRGAAEDLRLLDNARANGKLLATKHNPNRRVISPADRESIKAEAQAKAIGAHTYVRSLPARDPTPRKGLVVDVVKVRAMSARIKLICVRDAGRLRAGADMESAFEYRELARSLTEATINKDAKRGEYRGKSDTDRERIYLRQIEDICDRSNAVIRPNWWAK